MIMMMMTIAVNSNPPASERVTGKFEFSSKMKASAAQSPVTLSSLLQSFFWSCGAKIRMDSMMLTMAERAEGVPVGNSPSATISWSVPRACP